MIEQLRALLQELEELEVWAERSLAAVAWRAHAIAGPRAPWLSRIDAAGEPLSIDHCLKRCYRDAFAALPSTTPLLDALKGVRTARRSPTGIYFNVTCQ